jgi:hypothetical protein
MSISVVIDDSMLAGPVLPVTEDVMPQPADHLAFAVTKGRLARTPACMPANGTQRDVD